MNTADIIDSLMNDYAIDGRDIQARIDELEALDAPTEEESAELTDLTAFLHEAMQYNSDADAGETIIAESHFVDYIKEIIDDCYALPKELTFRGRNFYIQAC